MALASSDLALVSSSDIIMLRHWEESLSYDSAVCHLQIKKKKVDKNRVKRRRAVMEELLKIKTKSINPRRYSRKRLKIKPLCSSTASTTQPRDDGDYELPKRTVIRSNKKLIEKPVFTW